MTNIFVLVGGVRALVASAILLPWLSACGDDTSAMPAGPETALDAGAGVDAGISHDPAVEPKDMDAAVADAALADTLTPAPAVKGFAAVYPLFAEHCAPCHTEAAAGWLGFDSETIAYRELVGSLATEACEGGPKQRVVPGDPEGSVLMRRLSGDSCGEPMPSGGPPLDGAQLEQVRRWIEDGALRD